MKTKSYKSLFQVPIKIEKNRKNSEISSIDEVDETEYTNIITNKKNILNSSKNNLNIPFLKKKFFSKKLNSQIKDNRKSDNNYSIQNIFLTSDSLPTMKIFYSKYKHEKLINSLKKRFKLDNLKNEIIIKNQLNYYSPNEYFEPQTFFPSHHFLRNLNSRNKYKPAVIYNKNEIFSKENPIKYGFRSFYKSNSTDYVNNNNNKFNNDNDNKNNENNKINLKCFSTSKKRKINKKKFFEVIKELKKINKVILNKNQELTQEISKKQKLSLSLSDGNLINKNKKKKKKESYDFSHLLRNEKSVLINYDKLLENNGKNVKLYLEPSNYKYVDQAINQLKNEERLLHKKLEGNNEYDIKSKFLIMLNDFKKVAFTNMKYKEIFNLGDFYSKPKESELSIMKRKIEKITKNFMDEDFLKHQIKRDHILRNIQNEKFSIYNPKKKQRIKKEEIKFYI